MNYTPNYQLSLWDADDRIMREDFNDNNAKLDTAVKAANDRIDTLGTSKANAAALGAETTARQNADTALGSRIDSEAQARESADSAEATARANTDSALGGRIDSEVASREAAVNAITANLGAVGKNLRLVTGTYTGTGTYGSNNPTSLQFPSNFTAVLVTIVHSSSYDSGKTWLLRPATTAQAINDEDIRSYNNCPLHVTWSAHGVSWYTTNGGYNPQLRQNNSLNTTYYWFALGYDE